MGKLTDNLVETSQSIALRRYGRDVIDYVKGNTGFVWVNDKTNICFKEDVKFEAMMINENDGIGSGSLDQLVYISLVAYSTKAEENYHTMGLLPECMKVDNLTFSVKQDGKALIKYIRQVHDDLVDLVNANKDTIDLLNEFKAWSPSMA